MGAMASRIIGNSTDCSAASPGNQVRRQNVHIAGPLWGESNQSLVFPLTKEQQCGKCRIILIEIIRKSIPGEQTIFLMAYFIDAYASMDFKESTHIC